MERLTERFSNGQAAVKGCGKNCKYNFRYCGADCNCPTLGDIYDKLARYEEMEEQGLLHILTEKERLLKYINTDFHTDWYNPFYVMAETFEKEDIENMNDDTVEACLKIAKVIGNFMEY